MRRTQPKGNRQNFCKTRRTISPSPTRPKVYWPESPKLKYHLVTFPSLTADENFAGNDFIKFPLSCQIVDNSAARISRGFYWYEPNDDTNEANKDTLIFGDSLAYKKNVILESGSMLS